MKSKFLKPRQCRRRTDSRQNWHLANFSGWRSARNSVRKWFQLRNSRTLRRSLGDASGLYEKRKNANISICIYILCLSWLTACNILTWTMVRHRRVSSCICMRACHYSSMRIAKFFTTLFNRDSTFFNKRYHCTAISILSMNQQICQRYMCIFTQLLLQISFARVIKI